PEDPGDTNTADGRPATRAEAHARLSRMVGGDPEMTPEEVTRSIAEGVAEQQLDRLRWAANAVARRANRLSGIHEEKELPVIVSGSGEFLAREVEQFV